MLADGADVNAKNDGGQTAIILAIVTGQYQLIELLLDAHADPFLQDQTGLNAIQWAQRKGRTDLADSLSHYSRLDTREADVTRPRPEQQTAPRSESTNERVPLSPDEKSRRFVAGLKQRLDERAIREIHAPPSPSEPIDSEALAPTPKARTVPIMSNTLANEDRLHTSPLHEEERCPPSSSRKKCPQCGTIYDSSLLGYCVYHEVALVDADAPIVTPRPQSESNVLVWGLVMLALVLGTLVGLFVINRLFDTTTNPKPSAAAPQPAPSQKGKPQLEEQLEGKADFLPDAEVPANTVKEVTTITVQVRFDRNGRVYSASSVRGDPVLRDAAVQAAKKAVFSVNKLKGRGAAGTISYTFK
jgi:hypothetical protein